MSDNQKNQGIPEENNQIQRRRRTVRYEDGEGASSQTGEVKSDAVSGETRVVRKTEMKDVPAGETRTVPRPASLNRASAAAGETIRRPVSAPGYTQQDPVNKGFVQSNNPQIRQPIRVTAPNRPEAQEETAAPEQEEPRKRHGWLAAVAAIVLLLGISAAALLLMPESVSGVLGTARTALADSVGGIFGLEKTPGAPQVVNVSAINTQGNSPLNAIFNVTTNKSAENVRLVNENGDLLAMSSGTPATENEDTRIWIINLPVTDTLECTAVVEVLGGETWYTSDKSVVMAILPVMATPAPTAAPAPEATAEPSPADDAKSASEAPAADETAEAPAAAATEAVTPAPTEVPVTLPPTSTPTMAPTESPAPTAAPTETPEPTPEPTATPQPTATPTPEPTAAPELNVEQASNLSKVVAESVLYDSSKKLTSFSRDEEERITMNGPEDYTQKAAGKQYGVLTYRGSSFRQNAAVGTVGDISSMSVKWKTNAGSVKGASSTFYGIGWTGQAAIIKWSKEVREYMNMYDEKKATAAIKEVIIAGLDGKIYFLDLADGTATRDAINVGYPMKGSVSLHSAGYPLLTVGQYARKMKSGTGSIGLRFFNLIDQTQITMIDGLDGKLKRPYNEVGSFNTSALIDRNTDTLITVGSNGALYTAKLGTEFDRDVGSLKLKLSYNLLKTKLGAEKKANVAVDADFVMYQNYVYYADSVGWLRCVDTDTMQVMWGTKVGDAVEASLALDFDEDGKLWVYVANTVQNRNKGTTDIRRYDAATGEEGWTLSVGSKKDTKTKITTGAMAAPLIGQNDIADLAIFTISNLSSTPGISLAGAVSTKGAPGAIIAVNKKTGAVEWARELDSYSYSSPVAVYDADGSSWVIQCASSGTIYLLKGTTGEVVSTLKVEGTIDASPAVYGSTMVIGTTGKDTSFIYGISLQ